MRKKRSYLIALAVVLLLAVLFWWGGNAPGLQGWAVHLGEPAQAQGPSSGQDLLGALAQNGEVALFVEGKPSGEGAQKAALEVADQTREGAPGSPSDEEQEEEAGHPATNAQGAGGAAAGDGEAPVQASAQEGGGSYTCTITIRCDTILNNLDWLIQEKHELLPEDGLLLTATAQFHDGESAFDVLKRETKRAKLHMEFVSSPVYETAYIEGIGNLYELDCGERSGWMYRVNGAFPQFGASRYLLMDGDAIEWLYTCDLGEDIGGGAAAGYQQ